MLAAYARITDALKIRLWALVAPIVEAADVELVDLLLSGCVLTELSREKTPEQSLSLFESAFLETLLHTLFDAFLETSCGATVIDFLFEVAEDLVEPIAVHGEHGILWEKEPELFVRELCSLELFLEDEAKPDLKVLEERVGNNLTDKGSELQEVISRRTFSSLIAISFIFSPPFSLK